MSRRRNKTQPAVTCFGNKIESERLRKRAGEPERLFASNLGRGRSSRDRIAAEGVFAPSISGWGAGAQFRGKCWVGVGMGILHKWDGAPGRTRNSTDVNPPDFESGASTNSATGAPTGARRGHQDPAAARIIAKSGGTASRWTSPVFHRIFPSRRRANGMKFAGSSGGTGRANAGKM